LLWLVAWLLIVFAVVVVVVAAVAPVVFSILSVAGGLIAHFEVVGLVVGRFDLLVSVAANFATHFYPPLWHCCAAAAAVVLGAVAAIGADDVRQLHPLAGGWERLQLVVVAVDAVALCHVSSVTHSCHHLWDRDCCLAAPVDSVETVVARDAEHVQSVPEAADWEHLLLLLVVVVVVGPSAQCSVGAASLTPTDFYLHLWNCNCGWCLAVVFQAFVAGGADNVP